MATVITKKRILSRLRWDNISLVTIALVIAISIWWLLRVTILAPYEIQYKEHIVHDGDTVFELVQEMNEYVPYGWDVRDFVALVEDKNQLQDASKLKLGQKILIPVAVKKE